MSHDSKRGRDVADKAALGQRCLLGLFAICDAHGAGSKEPIIEMMKCSHSDDP